MIRISRPTQLQVSLAQIQSRIAETAEITRQVRIGPLGWNQLVYVGIDSPFNIMNPSIISSSISVTACVGIAIWAAILRWRSSKRSIGINQDCQYFSSWPRHSCLITIALTLIALAWAVFDDSWRTWNYYVRQRLFLAEVVFKLIWNCARISLLLNIYNVITHLFRHSLLTPGNISKIYSGKCTNLHSRFCGFLFLLVLVGLGLEITILTSLVFDPNPTYNSDQPITIARQALFISFDILYFLAGLEILMVSAVGKNASVSNAVRPFLPKLFTPQTKTSYTNAKTKSGLLLQPRPDRNSPTYGRHLRSRPLLHPNDKLRLLFQRRQRLGCK